MGTYSTAVLVEQRTACTNRSAGLLCACEALHREVKHQMLGAISFRLLARNKQRVLCANRVLEPAMLMAKTRSAARKARPPIGVAAGRGVRHQNS